MKRKVIVSILAAAAGVLAAASCGDDPAPTAPSPVPAAGAPPAAAAGGGSPAVPPAGDLQPAAFPADVRGLEPGAGRDASSFNAYDFEASWDGSMLQLALIEDEMTAMREASKPHRNRRITVGTCPGEPHHALQSCGDPIWSGSRMLAGRLELPPIPLAECGGWIVVNAAELSDDLYDGWRNAPCPNPDGGTVGSDGSGETWPEYPEPPAAPRPPETVQSNVDAEIAAAGGLTAGGAPRSVDVSDLFRNAEDTTGDQYSATSSDETVATVAITDNPRVVVTPVGAGRATIRATFLESGEQVEFDVTVEAPIGESSPNRTPVITNPGDKRYRQGQTIEAFSITASDADGDEVTVGVSGLPAGLSWSSGMVSGTVPADAEARAHAVTVTADDGVNEAVTLDFTITVAGNGAPAITNPGDQAVDREAEIDPFGITVSDPDGDTVTVTVSGLPTGLTWSSGMVSGTVPADAEARDYTVTVTANDGVGEAVTLDFTLRVWKLVEETIAVAADNARLVYTPYSSQVGAPPLNNVPQAQQVARTGYNNSPPAMFNPSTRTADQITAAWTALAVTAAGTYCGAQDAAPGEEYSYRANSAATVSGSEGWAYSPNQNTYANTYQFFARKTRPWTATCERGPFRRLDE